MTTTLVHVSAGDIARWLVAAGDIPVVRSDRVVDRGVPATDRYVEAHWLPHLGALGFVILRRLDALAGASEALARHERSNGVPPLDIDPFTTCGGKSGYVTRAVARLIRHFGLIDLVDGRLALPTLVPFLTADQVIRLPEHVRSSHRLWEAR